MFILNKSTAGFAATVAIAIGCQATALGQDLDVATAPPAEAPAQLLSEAARISGSPLTPTDAEGHWIHILPTVAGANALSSAAVGPVIYHAGGSIMPRLNIYSIYWKPTTLQNGKAATFPAGYVAILNHLAEDYVGHGIHNNNTQYYQTIGGVTTYVSGLLFSAGGAGSEAAAYTDTEAYPTAGCTDTANPGNCITDAQLQTELLRVMALKGWTGGLDKVYLIFTAKGEDSCFDAAGTECSSNYYCAYHSNISGTPNIIYANLPYETASNCELAGYKSPNNNPAADTVADDLSHELSESVTDPLGDAWYDSNGNEIGDLCQTSYGTLSYDSGLANQSWNGHFYDLQEEYDKKAGGCVQIGP